MIPPVAEDIAMKLFSGGRGARDGSLIRLRATKIEHVFLLSLMAAILVGASIALRAGLDRTLVSLGALIATVGGR
jgi:hypothetical protein